MPSRRFRRALLLGPLFFAATFLALALFYFTLPVIQDTDSYFHLAVARAYAAPGPLEALPWARFSLMAEGFGDKSLLFHQVLRPFVILFDPPVGGRWALALLGALLLTVVGLGAVRATGSDWGWAVPPALVLTSAEFDWRLVRLRPELLAACLLILVLLAMERRRHRVLGALAFLFALSYTAVHALVGLCLLVFLARGIRRRVWEPGLVLYPLLGTGLGLLLHPQFPHNLVIAWAQNVEFFRWKRILDVGTEIGPATTRELLLHDLGWWLGLLALWVSRRRESEGWNDDDHRDLGEAFWTAALVFGTLALMARRFVIYAVPLVTLAVLLEIRRRGGVSFSIRIGRRGTVPLALVLAACLTASAPAVSDLLETLWPANRSIDREDLWKQAAAAIPAGVGVAAPWGSAQVYMLFAPGARYLNVLDPVFMALPHPEAYARQRSVFEGREPDVPFTVATVLDSEYLAASRVLANRRLWRRLEGDPRVRWRYRGPDVVVQFLPRSNDTFWLDWEARRGDGPWRKYPRTEGEGRWMEGYVDALRLDGEGCARFRRSPAPGESRSFRVQLAPSGPTRLRVGGEVKLEIRGSPGAVLGEALRLPLRVPAGRGTVEVVTCPDAEGRIGFYLRETTDR